MGWLSDIKNKIKDDIIPKELTSGKEFKKQLRNLIPNELADVAVKAAPFVAPFQPGIAAAMRGIGRFDQRGSISDALKQAAATGAFGYAAGMIPGTENYFGKGLEGAKALGSDAMSGITSIFKGGGKNAANQIIEQAGTADDIYPGMKTSGGIMDTIRKYGGKAIDKGQKFVLGPDGEFQFSDITDFISDPKKIIPTLMLGTYIKEKFFPGEKEEDPYDKYLAERKADVESYLRLYGPQDFRRDVPNNPFTQAEIDKFVYDNTPEYRRDTAASGGRMGFNKGSDIFDLYEKKLLEKEGYDYDSPEKYGSDRERGILTLKDIIDVLSRSDYSKGGDTAEQNAMQAAEVEGLDLNVNPKGIMELDMREKGGFIPPVGVKEKADDIPAMLSNNEFVFTADAVRAAGGGSVDKGAQKMYKMMKELEAKV